MAVLKQRYQRDGSRDHDRNNKTGTFYQYCGNDRNTAVYIGSLGQSWGSSELFHDIVAAGAGGMSIVIGGGRAGLYGHTVAIPAVIAYNYFMKRVDRFINDMELCASELSDLIGEEIA
jgi:hypothetical protein